MLTLAQIIETKALLETCAGALVAGVGIPAAVSFTLLGVNRGPELWRDGEYLRGSLYGALAAISMLTSLAIFAIGMSIVIDGPG
ncbi:hypothetical protein BH10ACT11_BH10ACT11_17140 [soil metagenome]